MPWRSRLVKLISCKVLAPAEISGSAFLTGPPRHYLRAQVQFQACEWPVGATFISYRVTRLRTACPNSRARFETCESELRKVLTLSDKNCAFFDHNCASGLR